MKGALSLYFPTLDIALASATRCHVTHCGVKVIRHVNQAITLLADALHFSVLFRIIMHDKSCRQYLSMDNHCVKVKHYNSYQK